VAGAVVGAVVGVLQAAKSIEMATTKETTQNRFFVRILFSFLRLKNQLSKRLTEIYNKVSKEKFPCQNSA